MRRVAIPAAVLVLLLGAIWLAADTGAAQKRDPAGLEPGDVWSLVLVNEQGTIARSLLVRVTDRTARSCRGGTWNRLEILEERPARNPGDQAEAAYEPSAKDASMDLAIDVCDAYLPLHGRISDVGIEGTHGTLGLRGARTAGRFYGMKVPSPLLRKAAG